MNLRKTYHMHVEVEVIWLDEEGVEVEWDKTNLFTGCGPYYGDIEEAEKLMEKLIEVADNETADSDLSCQYLVFHKETRGLRFFSMEWNTRLELAKHFHIMGIAHANNPEDAFARNQNPKRNFHGVKCRSLSVGDLLMNIETGQLLEVDGWGYRHVALKDGYASPIDHYVEIEK